MEFTERKQQLYNSECTISANFSWNQLAFLVVLSSAQRNEASRDRGSIIEGPFTLSAVLCRWWGGAAGRIARWNCAMMARGQLKCCALWVRVHYDQSSFLAATGVNRPLERHPADAWKWPLLGLLCSRGGRVHGNMRYTSTIFSCCQQIATLIVQIRLASSLTGRADGYFLPLFQSIQSKTLLSFCFVFSRDRSED